MLQHEFGLDAVIEAHREQIADDFVAVSPLRRLGRAARRITSTVRRPGGGSSVRLTTPSVQPTNTTAIDAAGVADASEPVTAGAGDRRELVGAGAGHRS